MKRFQTLLILTLVCMMLLSTMSSCKQKDETSTEPEKTESKSDNKGQKETKATEEPMTIDEVSFTMRSYDPIDWEGSALDKLIQEKFGLKLDVEVIDMESYKEKFKVMFSTGSLPDISSLYGMSLSEVNMAGDRGMFYDYFEFIDLMPNFKSYLDKSPESISYVVSPSGALYASPIYVDVGEPGFVAKGYGVRTDILDAAGFDYSNLKDYDELYEMFKVLKQNNPDQYVIARDNDVFIAGTFMGVSDKPGYWNAEKQEWVANYKRINAKDFIKFWAKAYADGLLHPDFLSMGKKDAYQMYFNGQVTGLCHSFYMIDDNIKDAASEDYEWNYVFPPLYSGKQYGRPATPPFRETMGRLVNAQVDRKVAEKIMVMNDWFYTMEGYMATWHGEEGVDYAVISEAPYEWAALEEINKDSMPEKYHDMLLSQDEVASRKASVPYNIYGFYAFSPRYATFRQYEHPGIRTIYDLSDEAYREAGWYEVPDPAIALEGEELEEFNGLLSTIKDYADEIIAKMITGQLDVEADWDNFQKTLDDLDYDRLIELYNISAQNFKNIKLNY